MYGGRFGYTVLPSYQWSFIPELVNTAAPSASRTPVLHTDAAERYVLFPEMASTFGVRAGVTAMTAERSTIGSALFLAHHLKRLQGDRYTGFEIARMLPPSVACTVPVPLTQDDEDDDCAPMHTRGWAFDVPSKNLSKMDLRDLKFILTDLRQAGLLAYVEEGRQPTYHVVRHPDHAARFEQFYWDAMAGSPPPQPPRVAASFAPGLNRDAGASDVAPRSVLLLTLTNLFSKIYSYFA
jgi:hypothetical protein